MAKEDSTTAAAKQLGSMSLNRSAERNDENTKPIAKSGTSTKMCSACEKKSDTVMKCRACKCVWYCDKDCQNKHWKEHRKECKRIKKELAKRGGKLDLGTEKDPGPLPDLPPREECPICMHVLPLHAKLQGYAACCGKVVCGSCDYQHQMKSTERAAEKGQTSVLPTCAFCRTDVPVSDEEVLARLHKRVELKDPEALHSMALKYGLGKNGLQVDQTKCIELLREAAVLGFPDSQYQLGCYYDDGEMGLEQNEEEALKYYEKAAEGGYLDAQHNIGCKEGMNGDHAAAMRHFRLAAAGGSRETMENLIMCFEYGWLHHGDLAETLQAFYLARAEMKSEDRDQYIEYTKMTGEYKEEYDC